MDAVLGREFSARRAIRIFTIAWTSACAVWVTASAILAAFRPWSALFLTLLAATTLGVLAIVAVWGRAREVWADLSTDKSPDAYLMWTVVGAFAAAFIAAEGWTLTAQGFFVWLPDWLPWIVFALPIVAVAVRMKDFHRLFVLPRRVRREESRTR